MVNLPHVSGGGTQTSEIPTETSEIPSIPTEMPVQVFHHVNCHLTIYTDTMLKALCQCLLPFSAAETCLLFYELGLCASLGGEEGTAPLCHQSNFWNRGKIEEQWGKKCSSRIFLKTEQTLIVRVILLNFTAQDLTSAVINLMPNTSVIPFCRLPTQPSSRTTHSTLWSDVHTHQKVTPGNPIASTSRPCSQSPQTSK